MLYPYSRFVTKNVKQALVPAVNVQVYVMIGTSNVEKTVYYDINGINAIPQPLLTTETGEVSFYTTPGRIRLDVHLDSATTISIYDSVVDVDNIVLPSIGVVPSGLVNSSNKTFTLAEIPNPARVAVYVDGLRIRQTNNSTPASSTFYIDEATITLGTAPTSSILVDYWIR